MADLEKIVKLLNLTNSDNDNEALSAMRMVNSLLKKDDVRWEDILTVKRKAFRWKEAPQYFDSSFFKSIMECKEFTTILSPKQVEVINIFIKFYNNYKNLPHNQWAQIRDLWNDFREKH